jgi:hypothetical protein
MAEAGEQAGLTYAASGVSLEAAESVVGALGRLAASTRREGVEAGIGGFAGLFRVGGAGGPLRNREKKKKIFKNRRKKKEIK